MIYKEEVRADLLVIGLICSKYCGLYKYILSNLMSSAVGNLTSLSSILAQLLLNYAQFSVVTTLLGTNILQRLFIILLSMKSLSQKRLIRLAHLASHSLLLFCHVSALCNDLGL